MSPFFPISRDGIPVDPETLATFRTAARSQLGKNEMDNIVWNAALAFWMIMPDRTSAENWEADFRKLVDRTIETFRQEGLNAGIFE